MGVLEHQRRGLSSSNGAVPASIVQMQPSAYRPIGAARATCVAWDLTMPSWGSTLWRTLICGKAASVAMPKSTILTKSFFAVLPRSGKCSRA